MGLRLGSVAPNFSQSSSQGEIEFYSYIEGSWIILFSHPADFTPVCTTELGRAAKLKPEFDKRGVKMLALSVDSKEVHDEWIPDINETQNCSVNFPIIADSDYRVSSLYDMIHPQSTDKMTVRTVYIIDDKKKIRAMITYPPSTGRNFDEILRVVDSLQLTDKFMIATPVDWKQGEDVVIAPSLTDEAELKKRFPKGYTKQKPYLRLTPQPS
ncbi:MAG: peroxiredoxin [Candidatus Omnitrophica bacterium CG11_big_fil_rev_8_21_14_0_20_45_26]|uniref:Peroxiredoxin n=1 Tax=Candidatus Abzuiibacterium crystallinum TaxID=1974748 RepID=A0A2H0LQH0_9BACT|nr:MAG: peroxiredoxin [Candidatus Omnitrophica bacterium CG11_big_fil_rev_8_21_14_0_20_45_26]PIW63448.1 MAG: peroxiredoxin [Candidatus Omnitrophica bacterium CG12_big_fil_rev_8_21_14_0_65_45_16]